MSEDCLPSTGRFRGLTRGQCNPFKYLGLAHACTHGSGYSSLLTTLGPALCYPRAQNG